MPATMVAMVVMMVVTAKPEVDPRPPAPISIGVVAIVMVSTMAAAPSVPPMTMAKTAPMDALQARATLVGKSKCPQVCRDGHRTRRKTAEAQRAYKRGYRDEHTFSHEPTPC